MSSPAIILFCYNRANYLERTLASLATLVGLEQMAVYISQDGYDESVHNMSLSFGSGPLSPPHTKAFEHWQRERIPQLHAKQPGHAWLTQHYKWGLDGVFLNRSHSHAIVIEDDMLFSPDFLTYFQATAPVLDLDPTLWCISTWNDNGLTYFNWDPQKLFRTSYFPGLGWMLRRELWLELGPRFPRQAWDHWMRLPSTSKGRECISPEVNRNFNIGEVGANMQKAMFKRHFKAMGWYQGSTNRSAGADLGDLSYLSLDSFSDHMVSLLQRAQVWEGAVTQVKLNQQPPGQVNLILYKEESYPRTARQLKIWPFPRGHHQHIVALPYKGSTWLLADVRQCPLLPKHMRVYPSPTLQDLAAPPDTSCTDACKAEGLVCSAEDFWFINTCEALAKHFPCSAG
ncbi:hypothetical protein WJX73_008446 [Symbiochloris irregularis]|uniref:Alpha-1,3-mannosyl-glycoprotein 2-beta-N-acetylglucosaminyltransferase n=1 Tax=Symbiochloris irregularis TaxID=706552 RepID=A0AAW1Q042_9CHLO